MTTSCISIISLYKPHYSEVKNVIVNLYHVAISAQFTKLYFACHARALFVRTERDSTDAHWTNVGAKLQVHQKKYIEVTLQTIEKFHSPAFE